MESYDYIADCAKQAGPYGGEIWGLRRAVAKGQLDGAQLIIKHFGIEENQIRDYRIVDGALEKDRFEVVNGALEKSRLEVAAWLVETFGLGKGEIGCRFLRSALDDGLYNTARWIVARFGPCGLRARCRDLLAGGGELCEQDRVYDRIRWKKLIGRVVICPARREVRIQAAAEDGTFVSQRGARVLGLDAFNQDSNNRTIGSTVCDLHVPWCLEKEDIAGYVVRLTGVRADTVEARASAIWFWNNGCEIVDE
jgi:hypothetical protein